MNLSALTANWRTLFASTGAAVTSALTILAVLPAQLGDLSTIVPEDWKPTVIKVGIVSTIVLRVLNGIAAKDAMVSGNGSTSKPAMIPMESGGNQPAGL